VGTIVTIAVLTHDFSDGINTVTLVLRFDGMRQTAFRWLLVDAFAPVVGISVTFFFSLPKEMLGALLALFCGCFIYIGASELLPESHHAHPKMLTTMMTLLGITVMYLAIQLAKL
jgi:ZIP family zinc transporter